MTDNVFFDTAPDLWAAGLPVIPLKRRSKAAIPLKWSSYSKEMPPEDIRDEWLHNHPDGNIGLVLGEASGLCAIDLDTDDPKVLKLLDQVLPPSPWERVGKKGFVRIFKYSGHRTFRIHTVEGKPVCELLSSGTQVVLPPSIHPDTQAPYEANARLEDVLDQVNHLPKDIETILREGLVEAGIDLSVRGSTKVTEYVASGARDSQMTSMAGLFARAVIRGERTVREAISEMYAWTETFVQKVVGDEIDPKKGELKIIEFIRRDIAENGKSLPPGWDADLSVKERESLAKEFGDDFEEWDLAQIMDYCSAEFTELDVSDPKRSRVVDDALIRFSKQLNPNPIDEDRLLRFLNDANLKQIPISGMRKRLADLRRGEMAGVDHSEVAQGVMKEMQKYGEIRWENDKFYQWAGSHWEILHERDIMRTIIEDFGNLPAARRAGDHKGIVATCSHIVKQGLADVQIDGVNFANGFLSTDGQLRDHAPKYGAKYVLPYRYLPDMDGACRKFLSFLNDCWGDDPDCDDKIQALREAMGATMFGQAYRFSRAICLYGVPMSGKSSLMKVLMGLMPEGTTCQIPPTEWDDKFLPAQMDGKLLNACGELSENQYIAGDRFKQIVEGDEMIAQHKGRQPFTYMPTCGQWFCTNHLPKTKDTSAGFNRRWLFLQFRKQVDPSKKDRSLHLDILAEEREAIVAWAVQGFFQLKAQTDYTLPASHVEMIEEIANQNNSVRFFLSAGGVRRVTPSADGKPSARTSEQQLYEAYYAFCAAVAHVRPVTLKKFRLMARELQQEFGFSIEIDPEVGVSRASYANITLAAVRVGS